MNYSWPREPQGRELENLTQLFKVLGDPSRMKVLFQIGSSEACVSEVAARLNMSESAVSHHIHILRMNGLVRWRRSGRTILYQMNDNHVRTIITQGCKHIEESFKTKTFIHG